ncbi:hypothetical protein BBP00_00007323, partial [Phytophthora kernoviae]
MLKSWLSAVSYTVLSLAVVNDGHFTLADEWETQVDSIMANFTTIDIVGQMTEIAVYGLTNSTYQLDEAALREYAKLHISMEENGGHPM